VLKSWKDGKEEDWQLRASMPTNQVTEFNRLIELMNNANQRLGIFVLMLRLQADTLSVRFGWLLTLALWRFSEVCLLVDAKRDTGFGPEELASER
jgi:hypothetical protein